ncbi:MAG: hypothetical protein HUJ75_01540, partial [Parasporobacterium sp.]|nr:hypothetical protein [Parasporobacterium sp.]
MEKRDLGLKHLRRLLVALLSLALVFTLMACGQNNNNQGGGEAPAVESQAPAAAAGFEQTVQPNYTGTLIPTFTQRTGDEYSIGVYVKDNKVTAENSYLKDFAEESADGVTIKDLTIDASGTGFTAIAVQGAEGDGNSTVNISNVDINLTDDSDGTNGCDFTGLGTAIVASGVSEQAHNIVNIDNTTVKTKGFVRDGIIVDDYTDAIITNSSFTTFGADPLKDSYDGYLNTAKQAYMLSPPWIMSFLGGARTANVLGDYSSLTVVDSVMQTGAWAVLSTDDCTSPTVNVINSTIEVLPADSEYGMNGGAELYGYDYNYGSGYGTYSIGEANEYFYGAEFKGVTMATVMTGTGDTYYGPSFNGMTVKNGTGEEIYTYPGESRETVVNGVNGIMDHQGGTATLDAGSVWNTEEAVILKKGSNKSTFTVSGAEMNSKSGILFQMMDDDDGYGTSGAGGDTTALTYDGQAWGMPTFSGGFYDPAGAGLPATLGNLSKGGNISSTLNLTGGIYNGDVFNGTGSGKDKDAQGLQVNISHADVTGAISSAQTVHGLPINDNAIAYLDALKAEYGAGIAPQGG